MTNFLEAEMKHENLSGNGTNKKLVQVFRNGRSQAIRIPKEFELAGESVIMRRQPDGSILVMQAQTAGLVSYLREAEPWTGADFVPDDSDLLPVDEPDLP